MTFEQRPRMQQGLSLGERQRLRQWLADEAVAKARREVSEVYLSMCCRNHLPHRSPSMSDDQRRLEHGRCLGESAGDGCLCEWHDKDAPGQPEAGQ